MVAAGVLRATSLGSGGTVRPCRRSGGGRAGSGRRRRPSVEGVGEDVAEGAGVVGQNRPASPQRRWRRCSRAAAPVQVGRATEATAEPGVVIDDVEDLDRRCRRRGPRRCRRAASSRWPAPRRSCRPALGALDGSATMKPGGRGSARSSTPTADRPAHETRQAIDRRPAVPAGLGAPCARPRSRLRSRPGSGSRPASGPATLGSSDGIALRRVTAPQVPEEPGADTVARQNPVTFTARRDRPR